MARGESLKVAEKYAIQSMLEAGLTAKKIAQHLGRSLKYVEKYLKTIPNTVQLIEETRDYLEEKTVDAVIDSLIKSGMEEHDAISAMNKVRARLEQRLEHTDENVVALAGYCLRQLNPKKLMISKTPGRRKGVSIMTQASSQLGDELRKSAPAKDNSSYIYKQERE